MRQARETMLAWSAALRKQALGEPVLLPDWETRTMRSAAGIDPRVPSCIAARRSSGRSESDETSEES